ncbi:hypothetical protein ACFFLS_26030 [Flavobacterium procerum]|uniref:DUF4369 domain-containing protein n=1 Tax=Flavobacterium procerum TaxID=1455569 RepID=A0ABV6BYM0_9FLAO
MKYKHLLILFIIILKGVFSFGQEPDSLAVVKIESGRIVKKIINKKIESFDVEMYAVNYGNVLKFSKVNDTIFIRNAGESKAIIKVFIKNNKEARELIYKKKQLLYVGSIDFDLNNLPPNSLITSQLSNNNIESYIVKSGLESIAHDDERNFEKSFKLFGRLEMSRKLSSIDLIFNSFVDFFSEEDALFKIYSSKYAEQYAKDYDEKHKEEITPFSLAHVETNELGEIKNGIIWTKKDDINGIYNIYRENKIIKSEGKSLQEFQNIIKEYTESFYMN